MRFLGLLQTSFIFAIFPLIDRSDEKKIERKKILFNTLLHSFIKIFQLHCLIFLKSIHSYYFTIDFFQSLKISKYRFKH